MGSFEVLIPENRDKGAMAKPLPKLFPAADNEPGMAGDLEHDIIWEEGPCANTATESNSPADGIHPWEIVKVQKNNNTQTHS